MAPLVFLIDGEDGAVGVEGDVEGFGLFDEDVGELFFLGEGYGLEFDHFEDGEEGDDHGVAGGAGFEEFDEADGAGVAREDLTAELRDHLGYREGIVLELDADYFFFTLEDLLENADEVDEGDDEVAFGAFVVVEGFVGTGPDIFFDLLALVEELRGVLEFFVFDEALDEFFARIGGLLFGGGEGIGREEHFGFDVDERGGHVDEFGGDVDVAGLRAGGDSRDTGT